MHARLSILDLATVDRGGSVRETVAATVAVAQRAEKLGFHRVWYAEHHNAASVASSSPALLIAHVGAHTSRIRLGAGGVMLPNHAPLTIAEQFGMLEAMYPDRIDLGLGRASGTDSATMRALRRSLASADTFPDDVRELRGYLTGNSVVPGVEAVPGHGSNVPLYVLGSSPFGARLAGELGLPFAFASHFSPDALDAAIELYRKEFRPSEHLAEPYAMATANVIAADTAVEARELLADVRRMLATTLFGRQLGVDTLTATEEQADLLLDRGAAHQVDYMLTHLAMGSGTEVLSWLDSFARSADIDEVITLHQPQSAAARLRSVTLLGEAQQRAHTDPTAAGLAA